MNYSTSESCDCLKEAQENISRCLDTVIQKLDGRYGEGHSRTCPDLVGALVGAMATEHAAIRLSDGMSLLAQSIQFSALYPDGVEEGS
jgi:hypothetical protein